MLETPVTEWVLQTRMARNEADGLASVSWVTGRDGFTEDLRFRFEIGTYDDGDNYKLAFWGARTGNRVFTTADFHGNSGAISEETGEFTDITFSHQNGEFALVAGETELFRVATSRTIGGFLVSDLVNRVNEVWLATTPGNTALSLIGWTWLPRSNARGRHSRPSNRTLGRRGPIWNPTARGERGSFEALLPGVPGLRACWPVSGGPPHASSSYLPQETARSALPKILRTSGQRRRLCTARGLPGYLNHNRTNCSTIPVLYYWASFHRNWIDKRCWIGQ